MRSTQHTHHKPAPGHHAFIQINRRVAHLGDVGRGDAAESRAERIDHVGMRPTARHFIAGDRRIDRTACAEPAEAREHLVEDDSGKAGIEGDDDTSIAQCGERLQGAFNGCNGRVVAIVPSHSGDKIRVDRFGLRQEFLTAMTFEERANGLWLRHPGDAGHGPVTQLQSGSGDRGVHRPLHGPVAAPYRGPGHVENHQSYCDPAPLL